MEESKAAFVSLQSPVINAEKYPVGTQNCIKLSILQYCQS